MMADILGVLFILALIGIPTYLLWKDMREMERRFGRDVSLDLKRFEDHKEENHD